MSPPRSSSSQHTNWLAVLSSPGAWYNVLDADCIELLSRRPAATCPGGLVVYGAKHASRVYRPSVAGGTLRALLRALRRVRRAAQCPSDWSSRGSPRSGCLRSPGALRPPRAAPGNFAEDLADLPR